MSRLFLAVCVGAHFIWGGIRVLSAQTGSYEQNALRLEDHRGDTRIVRGVDGTVLGTIGGFHGIDVVKIVSASENATVEAKKFAHDYAPGTWVTALGIATLGASVGVARMNDANRGVATGLTIMSTSLIIYGATRLESAYNALSRAIWWYNRDLKE